MNCAFVLCSVGLEAYDGAQTFDCLMWCFQEPSLLAQPERCSCSQRRKRTKKRRWAVHIISLSRYATTMGHSAIVGWWENTPFCNLGISFGNLQAADAVSLVSRSLWSWMSLVIYLDWCYGANRYLTNKQKPSYFFFCFFLAVAWCPSRLSSNHKERFHSAWFHFFFLHTN